jgi:hypothetical protein
MGTVYEQLDMGRKKEINRREAAAIFMTWR